MASDKTTWNKFTVLLASAPALAALAIVGFFAWGGTDKGTTSLSKAPWPYICAECGNVENLSPAEYAQLAAGQNEQPRGEGGLRRGTAGVRCKKCDKGTLTVGDRCPNDGAIVPRITKEGQPGKCPKCGWSLPAF